MAVGIASSPSASRNDDPSGSKIVETAFAIAQALGRLRRLRPSEAQALRQGFRPASAQSRGPSQTDAIFVDKSYSHMAKKAKDYGLEIRLGLALVVLVLVALNIAANFALFKARRSLEQTLEDELFEAAVVTSNAIHANQGANLPDSVTGRIAADYDLSAVAIVHFDYTRAIMMQKGRRLDSALIGIDSGLTVEELRPILMDQPVFRRKSSGNEWMVLFPTSFAGSKYLIGVAKGNALLSSLENAGKTLVFFGLLGGLVTLYIAVRFIGLVLSPFRRLKEKAQQWGHLDQSSGDEVLQVIRSYEKIIEELKYKESELIKLNEAIRQRAEDLEIYNNYILGSIGTGIITLDEKGHICTVNRAGREILGYDANETYQAHFESGLDRFPHVVLLIQRFLATGTDIVGEEAEIDNLSGAKKILGVSISKLRDSQNKDIGVSIIFNDQTAFINLQNELEIKRRLASLGEMSGGLAHQLRNSIAAIIGFARLIGKRSAKDEVMGRNIEYLLTESRQAEELVARFLDFARPLEMEREEFDLKGLLEGIVVGMKEKYRNVNIAIQAKRGGVSHIVGDPLLLKQAVGNIIDNACKAVADRNGAVTVELAGEDDEVWINIVDNGPGISPEVKDDIFTPFVSGSSLGTGLGLPLARKIITMHQGGLRYESDPSRGTKFIISLPLAGQKSAAGAVRPSAVQA